MSLSSVNVGSSDNDPTADNLRASFQKLNTAVAFLNTLQAMDRRSAASFTSQNPVLSLNQIGIEDDTGKIKVGDGTSAWNDLPYSGGGAGGSGTMTGDEILAALLTGTTDAVLTRISSLLAPVTPTETAPALSLLGTDASQQSVWYTIASLQATLGLQVGVNVQAWDADLDALATAFGRATAAGPASLAFAEDTDNGANKATIVAQASMASDLTLTLPATSGTFLLSSSPLVSIGANWSPQSDTSAAFLFFFENTNNGTNKAKLIAPDALSADVTITLPSASGTLLTTSAALDAFLASYTAASASGPTAQQFFEDTDNGGNKVTIIAPASIASDRTLTLQDASGTVALVATAGSGLHAIPVPAASMTARTTNGAVAGTLETTTNKVMLDYLGFNASTAQYAQFGIWMPKSWNEGTITAKFAWSHPSTTTNFAVIWGIQAVSFADNDASDAAFGTAVTVTDTGGTTNNIYHSGTTSAMTVAGSPAAEEFVIFQVYRDAAAGGDTLAVDARLLSVTLYLTTDAATDA